MILNSFQIYQFHVKSTPWILRVSQPVAIAFRPFKCGAYKDSCLMLNTKLIRVDPYSK